MKNSFFLDTDRFVSFSQADKNLLTSALHYRSAEARTELVSLDRHTDE